MVFAFDRWLMKFMPYMIPVIVILGVTGLQGAASLSVAIMFIFAFICFSGCLGIQYQDIKSSVLNPLPIIISLVIIQVIMPLIAFSVGTLYYSHSVDLLAGIVIAFTIPTGVATIMWVRMSGGNIGTALSIVLINTLLSPILLPVTILLLLGARVSIDVVGMVGSLFLMIVFPSILGLWVTRRLPAATKQLSVYTSPLSKLAMLLLILINSAVVSPYLSTIDLNTIQLFLSVLGIACLGYTIGFLASILFKWHSSVLAAVTFSCGIRNTGVGAALAVVYFPPATALPIVLAIVFQQFLASIIQQVIRRYINDQEGKLRAKGRFVRS
ncbi:bile acid:sodium symporter family protein [Geomicrobium sp. JSM 1781026]|uniref:bile acid:sodium symporter family protein n=1 Tax=Geomicrobium sp. JSM 1781026 TaxID=3344580 RepID=UPI0035C049E9